MFHLYDPAVAVPEVVYNRKFAVRDLSESVAGILKLASLPGGKLYQRAVRRAALEMLDAMSGIPESEKRQIEREIDGADGAAPKAQ